MQHYYSEKQTSPLNLRKISAALGGKRLEFYAGSGVFSGERIDRGTEILINSAVVEKEWKILDLGCGYGPVGISIKKSFPTSEVFMVDVNKRAVKLAKMNLKLNRVEATVKQGNLYEPFKGKKFDAIIVNPPQHAGKDLCIQIIKEAPQYLKKGGNLQLVARHNKGGKHLSEFMEEIFGNLATLVKKSGYRVYMARLE